MRFLKGNSILVGSDFSGFFEGEINFGCHHSTGYLKGNLIFQICFFVVVSPGYGIFCINFDFSGSPFYDILRENFIFWEYLRNL